ncbi:hypothetical protein HYQ44_014774 [Verticillium longisporum]|nr:hypothetical protein HYQ44_014774 [Verticillium longisporum]
MRRPPVTIATTEGGNCASCLGESGVDQGCYNEPLFNVEPRYSGEKTTKPELTVKALESHRTTATQSQLSGHAYPLPLLFSRSSYSSS